MIHSEGLPKSENTQNPITEAEIVKQAVELNNADERARRERSLGVEATRPEEIEFMKHTLLAESHPDDEAQALDSTDNPR